MLQSGKKKGKRTSKSRSYVQTDVISKLESSYATKKVRYVMIIGLNLPLSKEFSFLFISFNGYKNIQGSAVTS